MQRILAFLLGVFCTGMVVAQSYNRPIPVGMYGYEFELVDASLSHHYLVSPFKIGAAAQPNKAITFPIILDEKGFIAWYGDFTNQRAISDFKYVPSLQQFFFFSRGAQSHAITLDQNFEIADTLKVAMGSELDAHDFIHLSNSNYLLMATRDSIMDLSTLQFDTITGSSTTQVICNCIQEFTPQHDLVWEWNSCDQLGVDEFYSFYQYDSTNFDYAHFNSVFEDDNGDILISFRHTNSVVKVERGTETILWRLGGKQNDFTFVNDTGFSGQHTAGFSENGLLTLFDNGNMNGFPQQSRAVSYALNETTMTAELTNAYTHFPTVFGRAMGSYFQAQNTQLINYGLVFRPHPNVVVTNLVGTVGASITYPDSVMLYRAHFGQLDFDLNRPAITCWQLDDVDKFELFADNHLQQVEWSTTETTTSILANEGDTIQYWSPRGTGFIGSYPLVVKPENCTPVGVKTLSPQQAEEVCEYYDLSGRAVVKPISGNPYVKVCNQQTSEVIYYHEKH